MIVTGIRTHIACLTAVLALCGFVARAQPVPSPSAPPPEAVIGAQDYMLGAAAGREKAALTQVLVEQHRAMAAEQRVAQLEAALNAQIVRADQAEARVKQLEAASKPTGAALSAATP